MTTLMATVDPILKEVYAKDIESSLMDEVVTIKRIERTSEGLGQDVNGGKYVTFPVHMGRNGGIGFRKEGELLPVAGSQAYKSVQVALKRQYGAIEVTADVIKMAVTNKQSFANAVDREMDRVKVDLAKDTNRLIYGDGSGLLASFSSADGTNTFIVDNIQYLNEGDKVDILTSTTGAPKALNRTITTIAAISGGNTGTVTYDGADVAVAAGDGIYRQGNFTDAVSREVLGFAKHVASSGSFQNLDPASAGAGKWASSVDNGSSVNRALSEGLMLTMVDTIRTKSSKKPTVIFTSLGVRRAYFNLLTQQRRYTDTKMFEGGMQGLAFNSGTEIPVVEDVDATYNSMWFINEKEFAVVQNTDWEWIDEQGSIFQKIQGYDIFRAELRKFWELAQRQRNAHGRIAFITEG